MLDSDQSRRLQILILEVRRFTRESNLTEIKNEESQTTCMVREMAKQEVEFFLNSANEPTVRMPTDPFQQEWPADSQRVIDHMQLLYHEVEKSLPSRAHLNLSMMMLREECRNGGRRLSQAEEAEKDNDPILQTLHEFTSSKCSYHGRTSILLSALRDIHFSRNDHIGTVFTPFIHVFSRKLRRLIPTLRGFGIEVSISHQEDGSYCTVKRLPDFQVEVTDASEDQTSAPYTRLGTNLPEPDGTDGNIRMSPGRTEEAGPQVGDTEGGQS